MAESTSIKLTALKPDNSNANRGTERGLRLLDDSLAKVGLGRSIVVDRDMNVIAGNKTLSRAIDRGFEDAVVVHTQGDKLVVVVRDDMDLTDLDPNNPARTLAYYDNRVAELDIDFDPQQLFADQQAGFEFGSLFTEMELGELFAGIETGEVVPDVAPQIDRAAELQEVWQVARGDVWLIPSKSGKGTHRLVCGDSTNADDVATLMAGERADMVFTDPPFDFDDFSFFDCLLGSTQAEGHIFVMWSDKRLALLAAQNTAIFKRFFAVNFKVNIILSNLMPVTMIDLVAEFNRGKSRFVNLHDAFSAYIECAKFRNQENRVNDSIGHRHAKNPDLPGKFIEHYSHRGELVLDLFTGSGTTIVASEQLGRVCYGMELEPSFLATSLERLSLMGLEPERT